MKLLTLLVALAIAQCLGIDAQGQIAVGTNGSSIDTLTVLPPASSWSTKSLVGDGGNFAFTNGNNTITAMDAAVNGAGNAASTISNALTGSTANPPALAALAAWSTNGYVQTRPTANAATLLLATLTNASGASISNMNIFYSLATGVTPTREDLPGHRVYYSLSGATNAWIPIGNYGVVGAQKFALTLGSPWTNNGLMYLLFCDDNASTNNDGAYQIDNFQVTLTTRRLDFEAFPDGSTPIQGMVISNQFAGFPFGISFRYEDGRFPIMAERGGNAFAFIPNDNPWPWQDTGDFFLTDRDTNGSPRDPLAALVITYAQPVAGASGFLIDVDNNNSFNEAWDVIARDGSTQEIARVHIQYPSPFTGTRTATPWSFKRSASDIHSVWLKPVGGSFAGRFALDNLATTSLPTPVAARLATQVVSNQVSFVITGTPSATYRIEWSPSLVGSNWATVSTPTLPQSFVLPSTPFTFTNFESTTATQRFYRAVGYQP